MSQRNREAIEAAFVFLGIFVILGFVLLYGTIAEVVRRSDVAILPNEAECYCRADILTCTSGDTNAYARHFDADARRAALATAPCLAGATRFRYHREHAVVAGGVSGGAEEHGRQ